MKKNIMPVIFAMILAMLFTSCKTTECPPCNDEDKKEVADQNSEKTAGKSTKNEAEVKNSDLKSSDTSKKSDIKNSKKTPSGGGSSSVSKSSKTSAKTKIALLKKTDKASNKKDVVSKKPKSKTTVTKKKPVKAQPKTTKTKKKPIKVQPKTTKTKKKPVARQTKTTTNKEKTSQEKKDLKTTNKKTVEKKSEKSSSTRKPVKLGTITWMVEQIEPSFWPKKLEYDSTMFVSFFLPLSENINIKDVESILVYSPRDFWVLNSENIDSVAEMDKEKQRLILKRLQCANGAVPTGDWKVEFTMKEQDTQSQDINITSLNGEKKKKSTSKKEKKAKTADTTIEEITYIVPKSSNDNEDEALAIPEIKSVSRDADSIEIRFSVNDKRVKNGYFWFDVPGEEYYKDSGSMIDASGKPVNGCRQFSTDGKECVYILRKDNENSEWFNKIIAIHFVASDTNRVKAPWEEQHRTVSARSELGKSKK